MLAIAACLSAFVFICPFVGMSAGLPQNIQHAYLYIFPYPSSHRSVSDEVQAAADKFYDELRDISFRSRIHYAMRLSAFDLFKPWDSYLLAHGSGTLNIGGGHIFQILNMSEIILMPSPGEEFSINITTRDQVGSNVTAAVTFQVSHNIDVYKLSRAPV